MEIVLTLLTLTFLALYLWELWRTRQLEARVRDAQRLMDEERAVTQQESDRIREHYESESQKIYRHADEQIKAVNEKIARLSRYTTILDVEAEAERLLAVARTEAEALQKEAHRLLEQTSVTIEAQRHTLQEEIDTHQKRLAALISESTKEAAAIRSAAEDRAEQLAGDAASALSKKQLLEGAVLAVQNTLEGYGDKYIIPSHTILDDLAEDFSHTEAGQALAIAREVARSMVDQHRAATCDYAENKRREIAINFVIDAFNGRADAIMSRAKHDNFGTLEQEMKDAYHIVNLHGQAFRNARILPEFLDARLNSLKWAVAVQQLRLAEREEQRQIKEQLREESKARREYERAIREAARDQDTLQRALEAARLEVQQASAEQKAAYERKIEDLGARLREAEERNQRALSMAQQTRRGHVYVISNIGSFGEHVYKIGLTRRLEPLDRIRELGDSSVPFSFDVHALIFSEDAPALETTLHKKFLEAQVNKVNPRKEFFRLDIAAIKQLVESMGLEARWTMAASAMEYRESLAIERKLKGDVKAHDEWVRRQEHYEPIALEDESDDN